MKRLLNYVFFLSFFQLCYIGVTKASNPNDTLKVSLNDVEQTFLNRSFLLLASQYEINANKALEMQIRLWSNPILTIDQGAYNKQTNKWFDVSSNGETAASIQQLIELAGKRNKRIAASKLATTMSQYQFYDLMRTLKYELRTSFYDLYFTSLSIAVYDKELNLLSKLLEAYQTQYKEGNIPFREITRLESLQFNLENEKAELRQKEMESRNHLMLLTGDTLAHIVIPQIDKLKINNLISLNSSYAALLDTAYTNRFDLQTTIANIELNNVQLAIEKSKQIPDLTLGINYDRSGSYIQNYNSITLAFDLPVWNHNMGNIHAAQYRIEEAKEVSEDSRLRVKADVDKAWLRLHDAENILQKSSNIVKHDNDKLIDGITSGYKEHMISLLEFLDYFENFKETSLAFYQLQNNRFNAAEELNFACGRIIINN